MISLKLKEGIDIDLSKVGGVQTGDFPEELLLYAMSPDEEPTRVKMHNEGRALTVKNIIKGYFDTGVVDTGKIGGII